MSIGKRRATTHMILINPLFWRGGRVAEGARLESVYASNRIEGSNPFLSAITSKIIYNSNMNITFKKATPHHQDIIFKWLSKPHIQEFWDNSEAHRDDIVNFMNGRKTPSTYWDGIFEYWVGFQDDVPYSLIMTHEEHDAEDIPEHIKPYLSPDGRTFGLDFCIGSTQHMGKGLAAKTLQEFMKFFSTNIESNIKSFLIDPALNNPRAIHVYEKAGFIKKGKYTQQGGYFDQNEGVIMVCEIS